MKAIKERLGQQGLILVEVITVVAILVLFTAALSGLLRAITVAVRNLPTSGQVQTYQQVVDQINVFLTYLSRDIREAKHLEVNTGCSECLRIHKDGGAFVTYEYQEEKRTVIRKLGEEEKTMIKEVYKEDPPIFQLANDFSVILTLPVKYRSHTKRGSDVLETRVFSFTVERRLSPLPSP